MLLAVLVLCALSRCITGGRQCHVDAAVADEEEQQRDHGQCERQQGKAKQSDADHNDQTRRVFHRHMVDQASDRILARSA